MQCVHSKSVQSVQCVHSKSVQSVQLNVSAGRNSNWILIKWRKTYYIIRIFKLYLMRPYFLWLLRLRCLTSSVLTDSMECGPLEAGGLLSGEEIRLVMWNPKFPYRARFVSHDVVSVGSDFLDRDAAAARGVSKERSAFTCKGQEVTKGSSQAAATCSVRARSHCTIYLCLTVMLSAHVRVVRFLSPKLWMLVSFSPYYTPRPSCPTIFDNPNKT
jgi:hypothetical protein